MATIPSGQKFHTVPSNVDTEEKGSKLANSQREIYTMQDIIDTASTGLAGLKGVHNVVNAPSGTFISTRFSANNYTSVYTVSTGGSNIVLYPFIPNASFNCGAFAMSVYTASPGNARILMYSDLNGFPNAKIYESADLDCSTTGVKSAVTTFAFVAGTTYWIGLNFNSGPIFVASPVSSMLPLQAVTATPLYGDSAAYFSYDAVGSAPSIWTSNFTFFQNPPFISIKKV